MFPVRAFGAMGDGTTFDTRAIQDAVNAASERGGTVTFAAGVYLTAPIRLSSDVTLDLQAGSVLLGSPNVRDNVLDGWPAGILYARGARRIAIRGEGAIDGNYANFFDFRQPLPTSFFRDFDPTVVRGGRGFDDPPSSEGPVRPRTRPGNLLVFAECEAVRIEGIEIRGSSMWTVHCADCEDVDIRQVRISTDQRCYNNDGIHLTNCTKVSIASCEIVTGDDCIAISGQRGTSVEKLHAASEPQIELGFSDRDGVGSDISVSDCTLSSRSSAVRIWSLQSDVRDVRLTNLRIRDSNRGIGIFLRSEKSIRGVEITGVEVETRFRAGPWWGWAEPLHISAVALPGIRVDRGSIEGIHVRGLKAVAENGLVVYSSWPGVIRDVTLEDVSMTVVSGRYSRDKAGHLDLRNTLVADGITQRPGAALTAVNVETMRVTNMDVRYGPSRPPYYVPGPQFENVENLEIADWAERAT